MRAQGRKLTDGAFEELGADVRFLPIATPTPERLTAVLAQVHKVVAAVAEDDDRDVDPALAACVQLGLQVRIWLRRASPWPDRS